MINLTILYSLYYYSFLYQDSLAICRKLYSQNLPNYEKFIDELVTSLFLCADGFHKIISTTSGALDSSDNDEIEFTHPCFVRGHPYLLEQIKRKVCHSLLTKLLEFNLLPFI